jgi:hypothetical protein
MILPDKYVRTRSSLIGQASSLIELRRDGMTVSELWAEAVRARRPLSYDSFLLSLDLLYSIGVVSIEDGVLRWSSHAD